jgi:Ca-activated chloride channel family protein
VLVPAVVTDERDRPLQNLRKEDFRLFEDGVEQNIRYFSGEDGPVSVGILFDTSGSMRYKMQYARAALGRFFETTMPEDDFLLLEFANTPAVVRGFTRDTDEIEHTLDETRTMGATALWDAIYLGLHEMKHARHSRKALLVLTDGGDNDSRYTLRQIRQMARESDVRVFTICLQDRSRALRGIAKESGGRYYRVRQLEDLPGIAEKIGADLHSQYVLGYMPKNTRADGRFRKIQVKLERGARAFWRRGYYAPAL